MNNRDDEAVHDDDEAIQGSEIDDLNLVVNLHDSYGYIDEEINDDDEEINDFDVDDHLRILGMVYEEEHIDEIHRSNTVNFY